MPGSPSLTLRDIKDQIERRAVERQARIERGEIDPPVSYTPLPVSGLFDLVKQLDTRHDFLELAAPSHAPTRWGRIKALLKKPFCLAWRWLLIRQVEFNALVRDQALESARQLSLADQRVGEWYAAVLALRLRLQQLSERVRRLEAGDATPEEATEPADIDTSRNYPAYRGYFTADGPVLDLACRQGDFVRFLLAEGVAVRGIDEDALNVRDCQERELPVIQGDALGHLAGLDDDTQGGVFLPRHASPLPARRLAELFHLAWRKVRKNGVLLVEADNPASERCPTAPPAEWVQYLFESHGFTPVDTLFGVPGRAGVAEAVSVSAGLPFDQKDYRVYAVVGRK